MLHQNIRERIQLPCKLPLPRSYVLLHMCSSNVWLLNCCETTTPRMPCEPLIRHAGSYKKLLSDYRCSGKCDKCPSQSSIRYDIYRIPPPIICLPRTHRVQNNKVPTLLHITHKTVRKHPWNLFNQFTLNFWNVNFIPSLDSGLSPAVTEVYVPSLYSGSIHQFPFYTAEIHQAIT